MFFQGFAIDIGDYEDYDYPPRGFEIVRRREYGRRYDDDYGGYEDYDSMRGHRGRGGYHDDYDYGLPHNLPFRRRAGRRAPQKWTNSWTDHRAKRPRGIYRYNL